MSLKKAILLASMALATAAFALPATASASWLHNHEPITGNATIGFHGDLKFEALGTGVECTVTGDIEAKAGTTTGTVTKFEIGNHDECTHFGFIYGNCTVEEATAVGLPWVVHINANDELEVTDGHVLGRNIDTPGKICNAKHTTLNFPVSTFRDPDGDPTTVDTLVAAGSGSVERETNQSLLASTLSGELHLYEEDTWGFNGSL